MIYMLALLFGCSMLGIGYERTKKTALYNEKTKLKRGLGMDTFFFVLLLIVLVCFAGLRTVGNDTGAYINNFKTRTPNSLSGIKTVDWSVGANPLFNIYCIIIKSLISDNPQVFVFLTALIVQISFLCFLRKYSPNFAFGIFLFIAFTVYAFTMAAMKQTLATAITIWTIPMFVKGKKLLPLLLIFAMMFVHPYVFVFSFAFFLGRNIWDKWTGLILIITLIISAFFQPFIETVLNVMSDIGDEYDISIFETGTGINLFRVAVYLVAPILSFIYRKNIRMTENKFYFTCINLSIISTCFTILAAFGGANMFGRMANYFDLFNCLSLGIVLQYGIKNAKERQMFTLLAIIGFTLFYFIYFLKYLGNNSWLSVSYYQHVSFFALFK